MTALGISERRVCRALGINRSTLRYKPVKRVDEDKLHERIIELACNYGRYGYRRITAMLRREGKNINHKRVERIWRKEGLKVPKRQQKRSRIFLNDGSCVRLRAEYRNHVWSYDFVDGVTMDGRKVRWLNIIDEFTHECLASIPRRSWRGSSVTETLADIVILKGTPVYLRSDNGPEFIKKLFSTGREKRE